MRNRAGSWLRLKAKRGGAGFLLVIFGAVLANELADLKLAQLFNQVRADQQADQQRRQGSKGSADRQVAKDAERVDVDE